MEGNFGDDHTQSKSKEVLSIAGPALATSSSQPSDSGHGNCKMEEPKEVEEVPNSKVSTNGMLMNSRPTNEAIYGRLNFLKEPIMARLEELTSMNPTVEVALEIADSLDLLKRMMKRAGDLARRGARNLREGAQLVTESQQILRSAILDDHNPPSTDLPDEEEYEYSSEYLLEATGMVVMNDRPTNEGIYGGLKVLKEPVMARLEVLISMDSTAEVGLEIADSIHLLCLINAANHKMAKACERAGRGTSRLIEGAQLVAKSQQILRSATLDEQEDDDEEYWPRPPTPPEPMEIPGHVVKPSEQEAPERPVKATEPEHPVKPTEQEAPERPVKSQRESVKDAKTSGSSGSSSSHATPGS